MPSIFFISLMNGLPWGGSEELWYRSALYAAQKGWKVGCAVYHWKEKEQKLQLLEKAGCSIYWFPNEGRKKEKLADKIQYKLTKYRLKRFIKSLPVKDYDMVVINQGGFEIHTREWRNYWKYLDRYALLFHNYSKNEQWGSSKKKALENWVGKAYINLFASEQIRITMQQQLGISITNSATLINPITISPPANITPFPTKTGEYIFAMFAALETNRKAQDNLVKALSSDKWKKRPWQLRLYGEGKDRTELEKLVRENKLGNKVFLKGHTNNITQEIIAAHLILQITHQDAMPITVVEALAFSRPVIVSEVGDMPVWIIEEINGYISKDASIESIDATLEKAWNDRDRWPEMGKKSFEIFKEKYPAALEESFLKQLGF
ncbi:glycosyltransferase [Flavisolibacter ginsengisoli]|jgi:glycosyltransferase involved in cell wall biosynthesis|uniref:Glycosyltransferase involved in cell wall bisynthesis n=1 Tax=Flavisolibacter ginsengisoli DSM 18119 TaxID=1121884 RepID=A0A1M5FLA2_9BACT|nr:glycosyltransferase [Flavisolibacter ginsengisoli]SHF92377.1 Glycosyltransferase involved in cell wall bisynthesis [Flavisolibacter ginsengisoli DSM 18119]